MESTDPQSKNDDQGYSIRLRGHMAELEAFAKERGISMSIVITDGRHAEFGNFLNAEFGCLFFEKNEDGRQTVRIRTSHLSDRAEKKTRLEKTAGMLRMSIDLLNLLSDQCQALYNALVGVIKIEHESGKIIPHNGDDVV